MHNQKTYKIGTRGSLLALTQCNQVKDQLEKLTGDKFELEVIKTQGDLITNAPLWQLDGKDFFTKELDEALLSGRIDMVVHSYKDLGSVRPEPITLAAITKRTYAHDILLIKKETIPTLKNKTEFIVGTSSPRRMVNLKNHLKDYLPNGSHLNVGPKVLRGNVNTRISKLVDNEYDAIVLALPGIERLSLTESSRLELEKLLKGMDFMILPQSTFPSSASQGALGIECLKNRTDNNELYNKLKKMEDADTVAEVSRERKAFNEYGGGCHLAVGINVKKMGDLFIHSHRGFLNDQDVIVSSLEGRTLPNLKNKKTFIGLPHKDDQLISKNSIIKILDTNNHYFVSSKYSIETLQNKSYGSLWAAGTKTMKELASKGYWVNGSADSLGMGEASHLFQSNAVSLMINKKYSLINLTTHDSENSIQSYERKINTVSDDFKKSLESFDVFYWTSFPQFQIYIEQFPFIKNKTHACGMGKTFDEFRKNNIEAIPFHTMEEFQQWIKA